MFIKEIKKKIKAHVWYRCRTEKNKEKTKILVKFTGICMKPIQKSNVRKIKNISNTKKGKLDTDKTVE